MQIYILRGVVTLKPQSLSEGENMNIKELVLRVSDETSLPASQVRKVVNATLELLRANVETGKDFTSPRLKLRAITLKSTETVDEKGVKKIVAEKKIGRLILKEPKPKV